MTGVLATFGRSDLELVAKECWETCHLHAAGAAVACPVLDVFRVLESLGYELTRKGEHDERGQDGGAVPAA